MLLSISVAIVRASSRQFAFELAADGTTAPLSALARSRTTLTSGSGVQIVLGHVR